MIYITGDCHGDFSRFSMRNFPVQKELTKNDFVFVAGDFGLWCKDRTEDYRLDWLAAKNFTLLFVDGNHENFNRLYSNEFKTVNFHGGQAHKIRKSIYHLMRGQVYTFENKTFFTFGGAQSHDIKDGILRFEDYPMALELVKDYNKRTARGEMLRIDGISWWKEELPTDREMQAGIENLARHKNKVDFIITHCCPQSIASKLGFCDSDKLTEYFDEIARTVDFGQWFFGHYHNDTRIIDRYRLLYKKIIRIL